MSSSGPRELPLEERSVTSQEEQMLDSLVERVNSTQLSEKDPDAAALLENGFAKNPDAIYILAQSVLVQNIALEQARAQLSQAQDQVQQLQQQVQKPAHATSFLGNLLGHRDPAPPPAQPAYQQVYSPQAPPVYETPYYPPPPYGAPQYGAPQYVGVPPSQPSFLRSAAQTAAGVAAGALAFEGVEALLHGGFGHPGMGMGMGGWGMPGVGYGMGPGMGMGMGYERPMEENIVNNYYDSPGGEHMEHGSVEHFHESAGDNSAQLSDANWNDDSGTGFDDNSSSFDDSSSFDGGGDGVL
jgi:hypothetical protein